MAVKSPVADQEHAVGRRINFGCGQFPMPGWVNVDVDPRSQADVFHDLERLPYPFENDSADEIVASHVLEHLHQPFAAMAEFARILRPGGQLTVRVPHFSRGFTHADHKRGFDVSFPLYFNPAFRGGYSGIELESRRVRLRWFAQPELKRNTIGAAPAAIAQAAGALIDTAAALSPYLASRLWCFWVGGFEEVEFVFTRPK
jgi:SAM-dependent methyltransferase